MRSALLWIHVISGVIWIGTCGVTTIAANTLTAHTAEFRDFVFRAIPRINRVNIWASLLLVGSGAGNLIVVGRAMRFSFSAGFVTILTLKVVIYTTMTIALVAALRAQRPLQLATDSEAGGWGAAKMVRIGILSAVTALLGAIGLILGLWLAGTG